METVFYIFIGLVVGIVIGEENAYARFIKDWRPEKDPKGGVPTMRNPPPPPPPRDSFGNPHAQVKPPKSEYIKSY